MLGGLRILKYQDKEHNHGSLPILDLTNTLLKTSQHCIRP